MKKTLATLLVLAMVASLCCVMFVSAEETNLALNKEVLNADKRSTYNCELTDGVAIGELTYEASDWFGFYWNPGMTLEQNLANSTNAMDGIAKPTVNLGEVCTISSVAVNLFDGSTSGIVTPESIIVKVSTDNETYTEAAVKTFEWPEEGSTDVVYVEIELEEPVVAQYVCFEMKMRTTFVFINELEVYGVVGAAGDEPAPAPVKTWKDTFAVGEKVFEDGSTEPEAYVEVPYDYTWTIDDINGSITGEDATICTTQDAYNACNPNWAITLYLEKQADGTYVAIQDAIVCPGSATNAGIAVDEDHIAVVIHSATSNPDRESEYANWEAKIVAVAVKAGDVFTVDTEALTVYAEIPGGAVVVPPVEDDNAREELEAELEELVGAPVETPAYTWNIETAIDEETGKVTVTVTVSGVDAFDLQCIEGTFHYDATVLTLLNESDKENALQCITEPKGSEGEWENMSAVVADGEIRLGAVTFGEATLSDADPMIFTLEFTLAEDTTLTGMYIDTAESYGMDVDANIVYGNGGYGVLEIETEESTPESSTPADDSSDDDVDAGDAGILVFAILGILAIAGAAVVIKVRN